MARIVLADPGGLDTSVAIYWLQKERHFDVIAFAANLGQGATSNARPSAPTPRAPR